MPSDVNKRHGIGSFGVRNELEALQHILTFFLFGMNRWDTLNREERGEIKEN